MLLDEDSKTTWNDSYTYYDYASSGGQRNYLKLKHRHIMSMFLEEDSEPTWNDSIT